MNLFQLPVEVWISVIAVIASTGCIAALHSWIRISKEQKGVKQAEISLIGDDAWNDAYPHDKLQLAIWLRKHEIKQDSHLGDFIRTCWSAWLGGRPASLTELHVLVARRERSHKATRYSAGIAALLLVCGIVGTLSAVKPVLETFRLDVAGVTLPANEETISDSIDQMNSERDAALVTANAKRIEALFEKLGKAFSPSLLALIGTIMVVSSRGLYSLSLHKFTLDLDRFAVDTLIPRYRVPSLSEQYQEVKATLTSVTESLLQREGRFHEAVQHIENLVTGISPALMGLDAAANASKEATNAMASGATSITEALNRNLGAKSSIHRAIKGLDLVFEKTERSLTTLNSIVEGVGESNVTSRHELESAIQTLVKSVGKIGEDHQAHQTEAVAVLNGFKENLHGIPATIEATTKQAVDEGITAVKSSVTHLHDEQKKWHVASAGELKDATLDIKTNIVQMHDEQRNWQDVSASELKATTSDVRTSLAQMQNEQKRWHAASAEDLKSATTTGLAGVTKAGQDLAAQVEKISAAVSDVGNIRTDAGVAFKNLTEAGQTQIAQIGNAAKLKIDEAADKLTKETRKIEVIAAGMNKPGMDPTPKPTYGQGSPKPSRRGDSRDSRMDRGPKSQPAEALQSVVTISTNSELPTDLPTGQVVTTAPIITPKEESTPATLPNTDPPNLTGLSQHDRANHDQVAPSSKTPDQTLPKTEKRWWNLFSGR